MNLAFVYVAKGLEVSFKVVNKVPANATVGWDFGVSGSSSTELNPIYTYENPGYYTVTLTLTEPIQEEGGEPTISTVSQVVMVTDSNGIKTHLNDSIYNLIDLYIPSNLVTDGMTLQQKTTYIQKWQLYIGPLVDHCIPIEEYTNELQYEGLENQLIMELAVWDFLNVQITSLLTGTGQYIDSLTYQSSKKSDSSEEDAGDEEGKTGKVKRIQTGPTEVEYFDDISDSLSTLYKAYTQALQPGGIMDILRQNLCNLASRLQIFLPFCDNSYRPVKVPRVVNRRHPRGIDGPNPPTLLTHR